MNLSVYFIVLSVRTQSGKVRGLIDHSFGAIAALVGMSRQGFFKPWFIAQRIPAGPSTTR